MPLVTADITRHGAVIDVFLGVSRNRQAMLEKHKLPVPPKVGLRALIDTGAAISGFTPPVFTQLGIGPVGVIPVRTPSTIPGQPCSCSVFDVILYILSGLEQTPFPLHALAYGDFDRDPVGDLHGILGRDVLQHCNLTYLGPEKRFELGWA